MLGLRVGDDSFGGKNSYLGVSGAGIFCGGKHYLPKCQIFDEKTDRFSISSLTSFSIKSLPGGN